MRLLGGSPGAVFFGTITIGLAHGDTLFAMIPAFSKISISSCTHCTCLRARVYGLCVIGGLSPVGILYYIIFNKGVLPKSAESLEKMSSYSEHKFSNASLCLGVTSASLSLMGSQGSISAGEVINPFLSPFNTSSSISSGARVSLYLYRKYPLGLS